MPRKDHERSDQKDLLGDIDGRVRREVGWAVVGSDKHLFLRKVFNVCFNVLRRKIKLVSIKLYIKNANLRIVEFNVYHYVLAAW